MIDHVFQHLRIRTGIVWRKDTGYILACDPEKEEFEPHVKIYRWHQGSFLDTWAKFNAHSICRISDPNTALVFISSEGFYGVNSKQMIFGNIFDNSQPKPIDPRYGSFRSVSEISGKAYAVGLRGMVYRLDELSKWARLDEGLPRNFDIQAIHGFDARDIYAVGFRGELWYFNGRSWIKRELPTNVILTAVNCAQDGMVYVAGHDGMLIRGRENDWVIIDHEITTDDIWSLQWFQGEMYLSTLVRIFRLRKEKLEVVDFGSDKPKTCYHLSATNDVLWSIGGKDVMSFDGRTWTRIL